MCFVQTPEMLRLIAGEQPAGNSIVEFALAKENSWIDIISRKLWRLLPIMERLRITGTDNVKTSRHRQVKAHAFHILLRSSLPFLSFLLQSVNAAEDVNLIFVNGNI